MALWRPSSDFSLAPSASLASARTVERALAGSARQAVQRKRIIWCNTLAPSTVNGTSGRAISTGISGVIYSIIEKKIVSHE